MPRGGGRTHLCVSSWEPRLLLPGTEGAGPGPLQWKELLHLMLETYLCCTEGDFVAGTEVCLELKGKLRKLKAAMKDEIKETAQQTGNQTDWNLNTKMNI